MMELDSQSMTPPCSPIFGYSGSQDEQTLTESGVMSCLSCKGAPRLNDYSFSPESYILRREVISAVDCLRDTSNTRGRPKLSRCFGSLFDPHDMNQVKKYILICRKYISALDSMSSSSHTFNMMQNDYDVSSTADDPDPWVLRSNVCQFMNVIVKELKCYRTIWKREQLQDMFTGLKKSLMPIKDWPSVLKTHCGFKSGNEICSSATYHFFHLQFELRWTLFLIFGATPEITSWFLDELIQLANYKYNTESKLLHEKQPFNCMCIMEIWTMIRLVIEHIEQQKEKPFWSLYIEAMQRLPSCDPYFAIWLTSHVAQISDYNIAGAHRPGSGRIDSKEKRNNAYEFLRGMYKEWMSRGGKSVEILKLSFSLFEHWGGDCEIIIALWSQWVPRLDSGVGSSDVISNFKSYSTIANWLQLISLICESSAYLCGEEKNETNNDLPVRNLVSRGAIMNSSHARHLGSNSDPFMDLVALIAAYFKWATEKDVKRLKSNILMKLTRSNCNTNDYGELGIIRVSTLFMALSSVIEFQREAVSMCERLQDVFSFGKVKATPGRRRTVLRAYSCMICVILKKKISLSTYPSVASGCMKTIDELLCQISLEQSKKELVMVYIDLLDTLPTHSPALCCGVNLGRHLLISSNLSMWFTNAGHDYVLRTARSLSQITEKIVEWVTDPNVLIDSFFNSEGKEIFNKISEKSLSFIKSSVIMKANRIPSTDMEPLACLAADITLLTRKFKHSTEEFEIQFNLFALNVLTCPLFCQYFVQRVCKSLSFVESCFSLIRWTQVWIRLVALDCYVPDELTELVLKNEFSSSSNSMLLSEFCRKGEAFQVFNRETVGQFLNPLVELLDGAVNSNLFKDEHGQFEGEKFVDSVIISCTIVLKNIRFEYLYHRGVGSSVAQKLLNLLAPQPWPSVPPPWEKLSGAVMRSLEKNLYDVFKAIVVVRGLEKDPFLTRKLSDAVIFAFFGFVKSPDVVDRDEHPAMRIVDYAEDKGITLVQKVLSNTIAGDTVVKDSKLSSLFISAIQMFRTKQLATTVMRLLGGVIRVYLIHFNSRERQNIVNCCINAVVYCCLVGSSNTQHFKKLVLDGFNIAFEKEFSHKSRLIFQLCMSIVKSKNATNGKLDARRFIKSEIIPLLKTWVEKCEQLRGIGVDNSLREPLKKLEMETANVPL